MPTWRAVSVSSDADEFVISFVFVGGVTVPTTQPLIGVLNDARSAR